ncbi:MAG TPA: hypothetical protein VIG64_08870 [Actinomycetota bacterium]|jgi:hypothetical protein
MTTDDAIRRALHRHAATHVVNPTLPPSTIARARIARVVMVAGLCAVVGAVGFAGLSLADLGSGGSRTSPAAAPSEEADRATETAGGAPLLLVTADGWRMTYADQFGTNGDVMFSNGAHGLELTWRAADTHDTYLKDREREAGDAWDVTIAGQPARLIRYEGTTDFTALWLDGDKSLELRGVYADVDAYKAVAATLEFVDEDEWLAALPDDVVDPAERPAVVESMLTDVPVHRKVDVEKLKTGSEIKDRYQLGAEVSGAVACAWIDQWLDANESGDDRAAREAVDAMATSRHWAVLEEMKPQGGWTEVLWDYADSMAGDGTVTGGSKILLADDYGSGLGCKVDK